jgi:hypothetical protein
VLQYRQRPKVQIGTNPHDDIARHDVKEYSRTGPAI